LSKPKNYVLSKKIDKQKNLKFVFTSITSKLVLLKGLKYINHSKISGQLMSKFMLSMKKVVWGGVVL